MSNKHLLVRVIAKKQLTAEEKLAQLLEEGRIKAEAKRILKEEKLKRELPTELELYKKKLKEKQKIKEEIKEQKRLNMGVDLWEKEREEYKETVRLKNLRQSLETPEERKIREAEEELLLEEEERILTYSVTKIL